MNHDCACPEETQHITELYFILVTSDIGRSKIPNGQHTWIFIETIRIFCYTIYENSVYEFKYRASKFYLEEPDKVTISVGGCNLVNIKKYQHGNSLRN